MHVNRLPRTKEIHTKRAGILMADQQKPAASKTQASGRQKVSPCATEKISYGTIFHEEQKYLENKV
jgi:hypothetical protein